MARRTERRRRGEDSGLAHQTGPAEGWPAAPGWKVTDWSRSFQGDWVPRVGCVPVSPMQVAAGAALSSVPLSDRMLPLLGTKMNTKLID